MERGRPRPQSSGVSPGDPLFRDRARRPLTAGEDARAPSRTPRDRPPHRLVRSRRECVAASTTARSCSTRWSWRSASAWI